MFVISSIGFELSPTATQLFKRKYAGPVHVCVHACMCLYVCVHTHGYNDVALSSAKAEGVNNEEEEGSTREILTPYYMIIGFRKVCQKSNFLLTMLRRDCTI